MTKIKTMAITCGIFTATFLSFGVVARAADLGGMKDQQTAYDSPAPVSGWTGGYVGGQIGYGWNSHDISVSHAETTPGTPASCKEGATMGDDGKCYTTIKTPAVPASCKDGATIGDDGKCYTTIVTQAKEASCKEGYGMQDGQCYTIDKPAKPESCSDRFGTDYSLVGGKCYAVLARDTDGNPTSISGQDSPWAHHNAEDAVLGSDVIDSALNPAQEAKTEKVEDSNAYIPAQEAKTEKVEDSNAYIPAQEAKTEMIESADSYIPSVDASSTIYNVARSIDTDNLIGGVTAGFDYQAGSAVFGLFGQYNLGDSDTHNNEFDVTINDGNSWMIGARAGGLITPRALVYGLVGYGWQEVAYKSDGDKLEKTFGHLVAGGGFEYKVAKHVTLGVEGQHWFAEKKSLFEDGGDKVVDERSDTRVLASVKYRFGDE